MYIYIYREREGERYIYTYLSLSIYIYIYILICIYIYIYTYSYDLHPEAPRVGAGGDVVLARRGDALPARGVRGGGLHALLLS